MYSEVIRRLLTISVRGYRYRAILYRRIPCPIAFAVENSFRSHGAISQRRNEGGVCFYATVSGDCADNKFAPACIDPTLVAKYDDIVDLPNHPEKLLIDVREPSELAETGRIPTSINIPLKTVRDELQLDAAAFEAKYGRPKPTANDPIIFSCRSGVRAGQAANEADKLGFHNVKNYVGSWREYAEKQGLPA